MKTIRAAPDTTYYCYWGLFGGMAAISPSGSCGNIGGGSFKNGPLYRLFDTGIFLFVYSGW